MPLRIDPTQRQLKAPRVPAPIDAFGDRLIGHYTVVRVNRFRFRRLGAAD